MNKAPPTVKTPPASPEAKAEPRKKFRTFGLKAVDVVLYPILTNLGVFATSVGLTYLTLKGGDRHPETGKLIYGQVGDWFAKRSGRIIGWFEKLGLSRKQAEMANMVGCSFVDGSLLAPGVLWAENRREQFASKIDDWVGTPQEERLLAYQNEPKQGIGSLGGGRVATLAAVLTAAVTLEKTGMNDVLFHNPGLKVGEYIAAKPNLAKRFGPLHIPTLFKVSFFEAFYTSVCTAGLYFCSRALATFMGKKKEASPAPEAVAAVASALPPVPSSMPASAKTDPALPHPQVMEPRMSASATSLAMERL